MQPRLLGSAVASAVVLGVVLLGGWWAGAEEPAGRSPLVSALDAQPGGVLVAGFTDWASIRERLDVGEEPSAAGRATLTDAASLRDLSTRSVLGSSIEAMHELYGWSAADLDWESYGRSPEGSAMVGRLGDGVSFDQVRNRLEALGYTPDGDVWTLAEAGRQQVGPELAATFGTIAIAPGRRLVVAATDSAYAATVLDTISDEGPSLLSTRAAADVARALNGSDTALLETGAFGCRSTAVGDDPQVRAQAVAAVQRAGRLAAPTYTGRGMVDGDPQTIRFALAFASPAQAAAQVPVRTALSSGPFIGRTGQVQESLDLTGTEVDGSTLTLRFDLDPDRGAYMDAQGTVLFAGCPLTAS